MAPAPREELANEVRVHLVLDRPPPVQSIRQRLGGTRDDAEALIEEVRSEFTTAIRTGLEPFAVPIRFAGFRIERRIGRGTMAHVFLGRDGEGNARAIKVISPLPGNDESQPELRGLQEARILEEISGHPGLVEVFEHGTFLDYHYIVMEWMPAGNLHDADPLSWPGDGGAGLTDFAERAATLAEGLAHAHRHGVAHRDIKPANVLVGEDGALKLGDFGMAKVVAPADFGETMARIADLSISGSARMLPGTPYYWAPELLESRDGDADGAIAKQADVYSLGLVLYEALAGREAWPHLSDRTYHEQFRILTTRTIPCRHPKRLRAIVPGFDRDLEGIVFRAISKRPERRYPGAGALAADLRAFASRPPGKRFPRVSRAGLLADAHRRGLATARRFLSRGAALAAAIVLVVFAGTFVAGRLGEARALSLIEEAENAATPEAARPLLDRFLADYPDSPHVPHVLMLRGRVRMDLDDRGGSFQSRVEAFVRDPEGTDGGRALVELVRRILQEGRAADALRLLERTRDLDLPPAEHAEHTMLLAEALLATERPGAGLPFLERAEALASHLPEDRRRRLSLLRTVYEEFAPVRRIPLPDLEPSVALVAGRFRDGERNLLVVSGGGVHLFRTDGGDLAEEALAIEDIGDFWGHGHAADVDGDGRDELVLPILAGEGIEIRVYDLSGSAARELSRTAVREGCYDINDAQLDDEAGPELLLAASYPGRGAVLLRNTGGFAFEEMDPGDLAEIEAHNSDLTHLAVADLDGDGREEIVASSMAYGEFSIRVFGFEAGRIVSRYRHSAGFVRGGRAIDVDGDGVEEIVYALDAQFPVTCWKRFPDFDPQGLYRLDHGPDGYETGCIFHTRRLSRDVDADPPPGRFGYGLEGVGNSPGLGPVGLVHVNFAEGKVVGGRAWRIHRLAEGSVEGFPISDATGSGTAFVDLDGDGDLECCLLGPRLLRIFGLPGELDARPLEPAEPLGLEGLGPDLTAGQLLQSLGLPGEAAEEYERARKTARDPTVGRLALEGLLGARAAERRYQECLRLVDVLEREYPAARSAARLQRAHFQRCRFDLVAAAEVYRQAAEFGTVSAGGREEAEDWSEALTGWRDVVRTPVPVPDGWLLTDPGWCDFTAAGEIRLSDREGLSQVRAYRPLSYGGGSFQLSFEIRIDEMEWSAECRVGVGDPESVQNPLEGLSFAADNTSTWPNGCHLGVRDGEARSWVGSLRPLPRERWVRVTLTWLAERSEAGLRVSDAETGRDITVQQISPTSLPTDRLLAVIVALDGEQAGYPIDVRVRRLEFLTPAGTRIRLAEEPDGPLLPFRRGNAALARNDAVTATSIWRRWLAAGAPNGPERDFATRLLDAIASPPSPDTPDAARLESLRAARPYLR